MEYVEIGATGIKASPIAFGAMGIGGGFRYPDADDQVSIKAVQHALDQGINFFDTAPVYGFGHSEEVLGRALKGRRDKAVISTKCGLWWDDDEGSYRFTWDGHAVKRNLSARTIRQELERSLRLLQTDYIDIYYVHNPACPPFLTPVEETIDALKEFVKEGKVRALGVSNCDTAYAQSFLDRGANLAMIQRHFSILERGPEQDILPFAREKELSVHGYSPLEKGLLAGTVGLGYDVSRDESRKDGGALWRQPALDQAVAFAQGLERDVAAPAGLTLAELAVAYSIAKGAIPIVGMRKPHHVDSVAKAADAKLSADALAEIDRRSDELLSKIGA